MSTYLEYYNENIAPSLQAIDLFLKTTEEKQVDIKKISELLDLSTKEIETLMRAIGISYIDKVSFFTIMQYGSSPICKLFARELQRKLPLFYSFHDISYIYQIPYETIVEAAKKANLSDITNENIHTLFSNIELVSSH
jgi:hypothetical protein